MHAPRATLAASLATVAVAALAGLASWDVPGAAPAGAIAASAQEGAAQRAFTVVARKYAFDPAQIEVHRNDLVSITLRAEDIAHSFTIDAYRIAKRAGAGQTVTFEFRADKPGRFRYYCDLRLDEGCRNMHGELVVHER